MKPPFFKFLFVVLICFPSLRLAASDKVYDAVGVVRAPLDQEGQISIAHEEIRGLMPAMTMRFETVNPKEAASLKSGDHIRFRLHVTETDMKASDFVVTGVEKNIVAEQSTNSRSVRLHEGDQVPEFSLLTQNGRPFTAQDLRGRTTVLTFIFTRCPRVDYCPLMAQHFEKLQAGLRADPKTAGRIQLLSISLDPEYDTPEVLKAYGQAVGADFSVWQFLTGNKDEVAGLTRAFSVFAERSGVTIDHTLCTVLIDASGRVSRIWRGNGWRTEEISDALGIR